MLMPSLYNQLIRLQKATCRFKNIYQSTCWVFYCTVSINTDNSTNGSHLKIPAYTDLLKSFKRKTEKIGFDICEIQNRITRTSTTEGRTHEASEEVEGAPSSSAALAKICGLWTYHPVMMYVCRKSAQFSYPVHMPDTTFCITPGTPYCPNDVQCPPLCHKGWRSSSFRVLYFSFTPFWWTRCAGGGFNSPQSFIDT